MIAGLSPTAPTPGRRFGPTIIERLAQFQRPATMAVRRVGQGGDGTASIEEQLFDANAKSARLVSELSMHLPNEWRECLLGQLRSLLSFELWDDDSNLLDEASVRSFLRFVIFGSIRRLPSLGVSNRRRLTAAWTWPDRRLAIEFAANDRCRAVFSYPGRFEGVRQAMDCNVGDAVGVLAGHGFSLDEKAP